MAFITAIFSKNLFACLGISRGSRFALFALRRATLRSERRPRKQKDRACHGHSDAPGHARTATLDHLHECQDHIHEFLFGAIVPQD
jgi:hypothetical protein